MKIRNQKNEISNAEVIKLASVCVQKYIQEMGWKVPNDITMNILEIYESVIYPEYEISLNTEHNLGTNGEQKILGKMLSKEKIILIDRSINEESHDPRFTFTLGHEIGHAVAHVGQSAYFRCTEYTIYDKVQNLQEYQANLFAENIIMPDGFVKNRFEYYYDVNRPILYKGAGCYNIGMGNKKIDINSLAHFIWILAAPLTGYFSNISKESLAYKILKIGVVKNETEENLIFDSLGQSFSGSKRKIFRHGSKILHN